MRIETLEKANSLQKRITKAEEIFQLLNSVEVKSVQEKGTEEECLKTSLSFVNEREMLSEEKICLSTEHIEVLKKAFKDHKAALDSEFCFL